MATDRAPDYDDKTDESPRSATQGGRAGPVLEPNEARGAVTHHNVRIVLAVSVAVLVVLYVIVYFAFFAGAPPTVPPPASG